MLKESRRQQILDAAKSVFAERGYHAANISHIIAACDIARGTFYLYFKSKREIFETLLTDFVTVVQDRVQRVDETVGQEGIARQLRDNVTGVLDAFASNPELTQIVLNEAVGLDKGFDEKLDAFYGELIALITQSLTLGLEIGLLRPLDPHIIAVSILGSIKEVIQRVLKTRFDLDLDHVVDEVLAYNMRALLVPEMLAGWPSR